ncbi:MAG: sterol desaturase family protein [Bacteroidetes bacterium]|nr:sterol desaturase family protein [Bacteroidota bacterium]
MRTRFIWVLGLIIGSLQAKAQVEPLVSVEELQVKMQTENVQLLDVRKPEEFAEGHITSAVQIWRPDIQDAANSVGGMKASKAQMAELLSSLGITHTQPIIAYDAKGNCDAARFWWIMYGYGFKNVQLLDGGLVEWQNAGFEVETTKTERKPTQFVFENEEDQSLQIDRSGVEELVKHGKVPLIDTRTTEEYLGEKQKDGAAKPGRIKGSVLYDWANSVYYDGNKKLRELDYLQRKMASLGLKKDEPAVIYCHSGVRSAHTTFVLTQLLGYTQVRNYDGSWIEWSATNLPFETGSFVLTPKEEISTTKQDKKMITANSSVFQSFLDSILKAYSNYGVYIWKEITFQYNNWYVNYFWWLVILSLVVWALEMLFPWRKNQQKIRKDFWLDAFYMFFNFYIFRFAIEGLFELSALTGSWLGYETDDIAIINIKEMAPWLGLLIFFILNDFVQWFTHVMLHRFEFLWRFHKVHHSVQEMGFAAHLRYHWMENIFYKPLKTLVVMLLVGGEPKDAFIVHYIAIAIGHLNHANLNWTYGPFKYIFNNPVMHLWHHVKALPKGQMPGVNFGISLSIWDYLFGTNYIKDTQNGEIELGFDDIDEFPKSFWGQLFYGFGKKNS